MSTLRVRTSYATIARSRAVAIFVVFVLCMSPLTIGFLGARASVANDTLRLLYAISAVLPALGIMVAAGSLLVVVWRRRKVILELGSEVYIVRTGVRLKVSDLRRIQTWTRDRATAGVHTYLALIPEHIDVQMGARPTNETGSGAPRELDAYVAEFPSGTNPNVFEVVELIKTENPRVTVEKLGNLRRA